MVTTERSVVITPIKGLDLRAISRDDKLFASTTTTHTVQEIPTEAARLAILALLHTLSYVEKYDTENTGLIRKKIVGKNSNALLLIAEAGEERFDVGYGDDYFFRASVDENNTLIIDALLTYNNGALRHPYMPFFSELLETVVGYFKRQGREIRAIGAHLLPETAQSQSTNYQQYMAALSKGLLPNDAILQTSVGKAASKLGYKTPEKTASQNAGEVRFIIVR